MQVLPRLLLLLGAGVAVALSGSGCAFGPKALERSHLKYNEAVKTTDNEQLLLNLVRLRYTDSTMTLDVSSVTTQYEIASGLEARPFFNSQAARVDGPPPYSTFSNILPFASLTTTNRPTISLTPMNEPENIRNLFQHATLDFVIFLAETSWPISTVFRLWVDSLNDVPNAQFASGPSRGIAPDYERFLRVMDLLQDLQDRDHLRFVARGEGHRSRQPVAGQFGQRDCHGRGGEKRSRISTKQRPHLVAHAKRSATHHPDRSGSG